MKTNLSPNKTLILLAFFLSIFLVQNPQAFESSWQTANINANPDSNAIPAEEIAALKKVPRLQLPLLKQWPANAGTMPMADFIFVSKSKKLLFLMKDGIAFKSYRIALGRNQFGSKLYEGDMRTPEGLYTIDYEELPSNYHLSLHIDYPHSDDIERAQKFGRPPGGDIMIHGEPDHLGLISYFFELIGWENYRNFTNNILYTFNWTRGCIAVRNHEIEEIFRHVPNGTKIWIQR